METGASGVKSPTRCADFSLMRVLSKLLPALMALPALLAAPAHADQITMGSDLSAPATITEAQGADTAFWATTIAGQAFTIPTDGQILSVKVKGSVLTDKGGASPATLFHIQSLEPAAADGSRLVYLTSQGFDMPVDSPTAVTTYTPENLCVHAGGAVDLNEIGGFEWGGSLTAPLDPRHYGNGTPYEIFGAVRDSATARYTASDQTNNGQTLYPQTANQAPGAPAGTTTQGEQLLMQIVLATGDDRSQSCGGPRRHPDGSLVVITPPSTAMHIRDQKAYVSNNRSLAPAAFCPASVPSCSGTATLTYKGKTIAATSFTAPAAKTVHIAMKLAAPTFKAVKKARGKALRVVFTITSSLGTFTQPITIRH